MLQFLSDYPMAEPGAEAALLVFFIFYFLIGIVSLAISVTTYILQSFGMYKMASRRGIKNPWLAWIPVGNLWIMGSISDQYQYVAKGKTTNRRKLLLGLSIGFFALYLGIIICSVLAGFMAAIGSVGGAATTGFLTVFLVLLLLADAIAMVVFQYVALYDLYSSADPANAILYLVLSILVSITMPIFMFICRNKDGGMPPRKDAAKPAKISAPEAVAEETPVTEEGFAAPEEFVEDPAEEPVEADFVEETEEETEPTEPTEE